jgi:hypothetical protein
MTSVLLIILAGLFKAAADKMSHHHELSIFKNFGDWFNPSVSWRFKWKGGNKKNGERFWLSSTWLVFLTDGWHFFNFLMIWSVVLAIVFNNLDYAWYYELAIFKVAFGVGFTLGYDYLFVSK